MQDLPTGPVCNIFPDLQFLNISIRRIFTVHVCSALAGWGEGCRGEEYCILNCNHLKSLLLIKMKYYTLDIFRPKGCFQVMIRTSNENKKINGDILISRITLSKEKLIGDQIDLFLPK